MCPAIRTTAVVYKPAWRTGLARDRLTPTGQARRIGMRKYSKILGAFSMQTVRKLPEFGVKQREERAVREFGAFGPHRPPDAT